jgi:hypothetical protein
MSITRALTVTCVAPVRSQWKWPDSNRHQTGGAVVDAPRIPFSCRQTRRIVDNVAWDMSAATTGQTRLRSTAARSTTLSGGSAIS